MRPFRVVPKQPIDELQVEGRNIVSKQGSVKHDEVLGERPIEPLDMRIHLGTPGIGVEVREANGAAGLFEVFGKLAPIVRLELVNRERTDLKDPAEEVSSTGRRMACIRSCKGELSLHVDSRQNVPLDAIHEADDGIKLHAALDSSPQLFSLKYGGFSEVPGLPLKGELAVLREQTTSLEVADHSAHVRLRELESRLFEQYPEFLLAEPWVRLALSDDEGLHIRQYHPLSSASRRSAFRIKRVELPLRLIESALPPIQRPSRYPKGILGRLLPVLLPKV